MFELCPTSVSVKSEKEIIYGCERDIDRSHSQIEQNKSRHLLCIIKFGSRATLLLFKSVTRSAM